MSWERRSRGGLYYTRSRRVAGRVVREYVGGGRRGEFAAEVDAYSRSEARLARESLTGQKAAQAQIDAQLHGIDAASQKMVAEVLTTHGYHKHRGQWRRRRSEA